MNKQPKKEKGNFRIKLLIGITIFLMVSLGEKTIKYIFSEKNEYGITSGEIIKEVEHEKYIFVFVDENDGLNLYKLKKEKTSLKRIRSLNLGLSFNYDYSWLISIEGENENEKIDDVKKNLISLYNAQKNFEHKLYFGINTYPEIKNLKVNSQKVDGVFEYSQDGHTYYVWYFYDLKFNPDHFEVSLKEKK